MDAEGGEADGRVSLYDRCINAYGEARAAIKSALQLGQGARRSGRQGGGGWGERTGRGVLVGGRGGLEQRDGGTAAWPLRLTRPCAAARPLSLRAGGADSEQLREELMALDRAVQGLALELTIQVGVWGEAGWGDDAASKGCVCPACC